MSQELLKEIVENFDISKLQRFFRKKNGDAFRPDEKDLSEYNKNQFSAFRQIGDFSFSKTERMIVVTASVKGQLSERSSKKAQYDRAKIILKDLDVFDAGIFIFYDAENNFRFSLIYENVKGKNRTFNSFRRFTYFVSPKLTNKTFYKQIGDGDFSSIVKIKDAFSVEKVTKEFYRDIANWYFWAVHNSKFPKDAEVEDNGRNIAIIRLITRLIFVWFMRERKLVPKKIFEEKFVSEILIDISDETSTYYQAILQNLFFATLSTKQNERQLRSEIRGHNGYNPDFGNQYVYRYHQLFNEPDKIKGYFSEIPFLNGGLFECLDDRENGKYVDGFTATKKNQPYVPNFLFFSGEVDDVDLNEDYGTKKKKYKVRGLLKTLSFYNFTIDENDPNDAEIALDPELLGKVFENLLASYNPETASTARKATGSYYTPREIVDYMVTQSLKEYLRNHLQDIPNLNIKIDKLFDNEETDNPFTNSESKTIAKLIDSLRIVDPAVGSGAFPMGILNKLVFIISKLDPENQLWKQTQLDVARNITDPKSQKDAIESIERNFKDKSVDYFRKLYLIQKCIYGVDVQQIAVEIAKLRFFIALLVDENLDENKNNRGIEPLPNLDFKIMQGNSLLEEYEGVKLFNENLLSRPSKQEIQNRIDKIDLQLNDIDSQRLKFYEQNPRWLKNKRANKPTDLLKLENDKQIIILKKAALVTALENFDIIGKQNELSLYEQSRAKSLGDELKRLHKDYFDTIEKEKKENLKKRIEKLEWELIEATLKEQNKTDKLKELEKFRKSDTKPFFLWKLHFAEVFQGDNEGFDIVIANPPYISHDKIEEKTSLRSNFQSYEPFADIYCYFIELGVKILKSYGVFCFITSNSYLRVTYGSPLRNFLSKSGTKLMLINIEDSQVFKSAIVNTAILLFSRDVSDSVRDCVIVNAIMPREIEFSDFVENNAFTLSQSDFDDKSWSLVPVQLIKIRNKIQSSGITLKQLNTKIRLGLATGANNAFILDETTRDVLLEKDLRNSEIIRPVLRGRDIFRYYYSEPNQYLILSHNGINVKKQFPVIYEYLNSFGPKFRTRGAKGKHWTNLRACSFIDDFEKEKIIWIELTDEGRFALCKESIYLLNTAYFMLPPKGIDAKYLLAILNSKVMCFYLSLLAATSGMGTLRWINAYVKEFPIPLVKIDKQKEISEAVNAILNKKRNFGDFDAMEQNAKIDNMVYELYDLTPGEIEIVENSIKK